MSYQFGYLAWARVVQGFVHRHGQHPALFLVGAHYPSRLFCRVPKVADLCIAISSSFAFVLVLAVRLGRLLNLELFRIVSAVFCGLEWHLRILHGNFLTLSLSHIPQRRRLRGT